VRFSPAPRMVNTYCAAPAAPGSPISATIASPCGREKLSQDSLHTSFLAFCQSDRLGGDHLILDTTKCDRSLEPALSPNHEKYLSDPPAHRGHERPHYCFVTNSCGANGTLREPRI
jgi:hypothetical protein